MNTTFHWCKYFCAFVLSLCLIACGEDGSHAKSGQSIVRVNDSEITVHQVNAVLQTSNIKPEQKMQASQKIVSSLIDQEVLIQAAKEMKLDRTPNVMTAIEAAKNKLLAQAYIQNKVSNLAKPTDAEIVAYLKDNPNVFENRKIYAMQELSFQVPADAFKSLEALSDSAKSLNEVVDWLKSRDIQFKNSKAIHPAERLPKKLLEKMSGLAKGELIFVNSPEKMVVGQLIDTRSQPVSLAQSKPLIERALMNQKRQEAAKKELARLKKQAKIVFLDEQYNASAIANPSGPVDEKSVQVEQNTVNDSIDSQIEKGLSGL